MTTVLGAWGFALLWSGTSHGCLVERDGAHGWPVAVPGDWPAHRNDERNGYHASTNIYATLGFRRRTGLLFDHPPPEENVDELGRLVRIMPNQMYNLSHESFGWPWSAFATTRRLRVFPERECWDSRYERGLKIPEFVDELMGSAVPGAPGNWFFERRVPIKPVWPDAALNVLFYAMIWRLWFAVSWWSRMRWHVGRGMCLGCKYKVDGLATCPECGREQK